MNNIRRIWRVFMNSKTRIVSILGVSILLGLLPTFTQFMFMSNENEVVRACKEQFGAYGVQLLNYSENDYAKFLKNSNVDQIAETEYREIVTDDGNLYYYNYANSFAMELMGITLLKGNLPQNENEIVVSKQFLIDYEYTEELIGKTLELPVSETKKHKFLVTGIIQKNSVFSDNKGEYYVVSFKSNFIHNNIYASLKDYSDLTNYYKSLEVNLDGNVCLNLNMYLNLSYGEGLSIFQQYDLISVGVFLLFLFAMCLISYNITKITVIDAMESIGILRLIGVNKNTILLALISGILGLVFIGIVLGIILSVGVMFLIHMLLYQTSRYMMQVLVLFPILKIVKMILCSLFVCGGVLIPMLYKIMRRTPNELIREEPILKNRKNKRIKCVFMHNTRFVSWKLALNERKHEKIMNLLSIIGITLGMVLITSVMYYYEVNFSVLNNNNQFDYQVDLAGSRDYQDKKYEEKLQKLYDNHYGFSEQVKLHSLFCRRAYVDFDVKDISKKYREYLAQNLEYDTVFSYSNEVRLFINILGYDESELKCLYEKNHKKYEPLKDGEALALNRIYSANFICENMNTPLQRNKKLKFDDKELSDIDIKIKDFITKLSVYPLGEDLCPTIIVNLDTYKKIKGNALPDYVFIENIENVDEDTIESLNMNRHFIGENLKETREGLEKLNRIVHIFAYIMFAVCIGVALIILYSSYYMKIYMHKKEYAMLHTIGLNINKVKRIVRIELIYSYFVGIILAIVSSFLITKKIYFVKNAAMGDFFYHFPLKTLFFAGIIVLLVSLLVWFGILKKLVDNLHIRVLQNL